MPKEIVFKSQQPYTEEIAKQIIPVPKPPIGIGFEYFCWRVNLIRTGATYSASANYTIPKNKILYITDTSISLYIDNWSAGVQGNGYARITTNDIISYVSYLEIKGGRQGAVTEDSSDNLFSSFPMPLRIANNTTITFLAAKSSNDANSIFIGTCIIHGYLVRK